MSISKEIEEKEKKIKEYKLKRHWESVYKYYTRNVLEYEEEKTWLLKTSHQL